MALWLALLFALVALAYASVGFGGGSTYSALLSLGGVQYTLIPIIALACNLVVVTGGTNRFALANKYEWRRIWPLMLVSVPAAFLGGLIPLSEDAFYLLLGSALMLSALVMLLPSSRRAPDLSLSPMLLLFLSGLVGLVAGLSGIGGGIFLAPLLHLVRWSNAKRIAAFASLYILVNSLAGLAGQLFKNGTDIAADAVHNYWPLLIAVLVGGQIGSHIGLRLLNEIWLRRATAALIAYVAIRLLWRGLAAI